MQHFTVKARTTDTAQVSAQQHVDADSVSVSTGLFSAEVGRIEFYSSCRTLVTYACSDDETPLDILDCSTRIGRQVQEELLHAARAFYNHARFVSFHA